VKTQWAMIFAVATAVSALTIGVASFDANAPLRISFEGGTLLPGGEVGRPSLEETRRLLSRRPVGPYIVIDRYCNRLFLRTDDSVWLEAVCSTGSGGELIDTLTGRRWMFETPAGVFVVDSKLKNPWWRKPDWAFVEEGLPAPKNDADRFDDQMMGDYAIGFGNGYFIHGTIYERLLGVAVTHGCVRVGSASLEKLFAYTGIGTLVYVY